MHVCVQVDTHNCINCQAVLFALYKFKDHLGFSLLSKLELIHMHFCLVCVEESRKFNYFFKRLFEQIHEMSSRYFLEKFLELPGNFLCRLTEYFNEGLEATWLTCFRENAYRHFILF